MRAVSWNVLADAYIKPSYYPSTPAEVLEPARRRAALLQRLDALSADVLCLQEVEAPFFAAAAARLPGHAAHFALKGRGKPDGCAIFVRRELGPGREQVVRYDDGTGHLGLAVQLARLGVATTHLRWDPPDQPPVAAAQLGALLAALDAAVPWLVCGDFNADAGSAVLDVARRRGFADAYAASPDAFTCNANRRRKRIDFLLLSPALRATPHPVAPIDDLTPLPSVDEPSDHLPIGVELELP